MLVLPSQPSVFAVVLGIMQDGGLPHIACSCFNCQLARQNPTLSQYVAGLAIVNTFCTPAEVYLLDATPDVKHQLCLLEGVLGVHPHRPTRHRQPNGVFLTHAHMGHIGGLPAFGQEAMSVQELPVYASRPLVELLEQDRLWQPLVTHFRLRPLGDGQVIQLGEHLQLIPHLVPHRDEWDVGTFAFELRGRKQTMLYVPDIDQWELWPEAEKILNGVDVALVDACFYSPAELNGRPPVAHPLVLDTLAFWQNIQSRLVLTHFNHTNPLLADSPEREQVLAAGAELAYTGQIFVLS